MASPGKSAIHVGFSASKMDAKKESKQFPNVSFHVCKMISRKEKYTIYIYA